MIQKGSKNRWISMQMPSKNDPKMIQKVSKSDPKIDGFQCSLSIFVDPKNTPKIDKHE